MVKRTIILIGFLSLFTFNAFAQNVTAKASVDKQDYLVGDYINYTITVDYPKGAKIFTPFIKDSLKNVSLIQMDNPVQKEDNGRITETFGYTLSGYDSTGVSVPGIAVMYKAQGGTALQAAVTNPVSFTIRTVKVNQKEGIKDVKAPIKIPLNWLIIALWVLIGLIVLAVIYYLYRRYQRKKANMPAVKKVIKLPAHVTAFNSLHQLEDEKLWQKGMIKEYHSRITEIIRRYFEERFGLPALELTTSEAMEQLRSKKETEPIQELTYQFLSNADLVKFAKFSPVGSVNEEMLKQAYEIVEKTKDAQASSRVEVQNV